jgi:GNAT superfamily N-acetyltransferase
MPLRVATSVTQSEIRFDLPQGSKVKLRPVTPADDDVLLKIYASAREDELAQTQWSTDQKASFLRWQFKTQRREYEARFPDAQYQLIQVDGQPAGRFWIGRSEREIRLLDIALLPEFQNRGIGTVLLKELIEEARLGGKSLRHMVFLLNNSATRFYERLGFVVIEDLDAYKHMEWRGKDPRTTHHHNAKA